MFNSIISDSMMFLGTFSAIMIYEVKGLGMWMK